MTSRRPLGLELSRLAVAAELMPDADEAVLEVDLSPLERESLADAEPAEDHHRDERLERFRCLAEHGGDLGLG
jgi:hypothetical protein